MTDDTEDETITPERIRELAELARLELSEPEVTRLRRDLADVLGYVAVLGELDLEGVEPTSQAQLGRGALRDDVVEPDDVLDRARFLAIAPRTDGPYLMVPRVLDDEGGS